MGTMNPRAFLSSTLHLKKDEKETERANSVGCSAACFWLQWLMAEHHRKVSITFSNIVPIIICQHSSSRAKANKYTVQAEEEEERATVHWRNKCSAKRQTQMSYNICKIKDTIESLISLSSLNDFCQSPELFFKKRSGRWWCLVPLPPATAIYKNFNRGSAWWIYWINSICKILFFVSFPLHQHCLRRNWILTSRYTPIRY